MLGYRPGRDCEFNVDMKPWGESRGTDFLFFKCNFVFYIEGRLMRLGGCGCEGA